MARRRLKPGNPAQERWILSYADFITLLFAFFTTLYAMSVTDAQKAERLVQSIRESFGDSVVQAGSADPGVFEGSPEIGPGERTSPEQQGIEESRRLDGLGERALEIAEDSVDPSGLRVRHTEEGLVISLAETFFFDSGGTRITAAAGVTLKRIAGLLAAIPNHVRVEGHTDSEPVSSTLFRTNWHLSALRAVEVLGVFERDGIPSYRLSASGFADQRPLVSNSTLAGRRMNRRVDIVVLRSHLGSDA